MLANRSSFSVRRSAFTVRRSVFVRHVRAVRSPCARGAPAVVNLERASRIDATGQRLRARHRQRQRGGDRSDERALQAKTGDVVVVATVPTIAPYGTIDEYAVKLFENHGRASAAKARTTAC